MTATVEFMPREKVEKRLAELVAKGAPITPVVFAKTSGDVVRRVGQPNVHKRRVGGEAGPVATPESIKRAAAAAASLAIHGNVYFDSPRKGERGFSFNLDRVVHI